MLKDSPSMSLQVDIFFGIGGKPPPLTHSMIALPLLLNSVQLAYGYFQEVCRIFPVVIGGSLEGYMRGEGARCERVGGCFCDLEMNVRILRVMDAFYKTAALREWVDVVWYTTTRL